MRTLHGLYTKYGYQIWDSGKMDGDPLYQAGNCRYDSAQTVDPDSPSAVSPESLKEYCESTGQEMADENGAQWLGCDYDQDGEAEIASMLSD